MNFRFEEEMMVRLQVNKKQRKEERQRKATSTMDALLDFGDYMAVDADGKDRDGQPYKKKAKMGPGKKGGGKKMVLSSLILLLFYFNRFNFRERKSGRNLRSKVDDERCSLVIKRVVVVVALLLSNRDKDHFYCIF